MPRYVNLNVQRQWPSPAGSFLSSAAQGLGYGMQLGVQYQDLQFRKQQAVEQHEIRMREAANEATRLKNEADAKTVSAVNDIVKEVTKNPEGSIGRKKGVGSCSVAL